MLPLFIGNTNFLSEEKEESHSLVSFLKYWYSTL